MFKKTWVQSALFVTLICFILNIKIYSVEIKEDKLQKIDEYANYILKKSFCDISLEERQKIKNYAYKFYIAYLKLGDEKNSKLWYSHYLRLKASVYIMQAEKSKSMEEWVFAKSELTKCIDYCSKIKGYKEILTLLPYVYGALGRVNYQIARILNSPEAWENAEQNLQSASVFYSLSKNNIEKNNFKFFSLLAEARELVEVGISSGKIFSVPELKSVLFELMEKSKEIKVDPGAIRDYRSSFEIFSKIYSCSENPSREMFQDVKRSLDNFEICTKIFPSSSIESCEFCERFIIFMRQALSKISFKLGL
ncbi:MAG: hypothetical protein ACI4PR_01455 [Acutalibacteraceae bacterium]